MDGPWAGGWWPGRSEPGPSRRWIGHARHGATGPHSGLSPGRRGVRSGSGGASSQRSGAAMADAMVTLDGSEGEGGGQILRTALSLALLTGRPFRIDHLRANRARPGLRPQHLAAVEAAAALGGTVRGAAVGAREVVFRPGPIDAADRTIDIGTAGATALVLQTLHLPLALRAEGPVRLTLVGGTFNEKAPSFPFLDATWRAHLARLGLSVGLGMPAAGFYPLGGGRLEAWIEPGTPRALVLTARGPLRAITGVAGVSNLQRGEVAARMRTRALERLGEHDLAAEAAIEPADWPGRSTGAAIALTARYADPAGGPDVLATFVGLGARGKPAEAVADEAVDALLAHHDAPGAGAVDEHSADQLLLPLALAEGRSVYTVAAVTEHLRTNARTIAAFLDRPIRVEEPEGDRPGRVIVG